MSQPHACAQLFLPAEDSERAIRAALTENPKNATYFSAPTPDGVAADAGMGGAPMALALSVRKMWAAGRTLRVSLRGGSEIVRSKVKQFAATWSQHANIHFEFVDQEPAEIRVGFEMNGRSWSYVGTDCLTIAAADPTMNLGWFTDVTPDDEFSRTTIHEFGHAIGCIHEHQQPNARINWDRNFVYNYYAVNSGWSRAQVDSQVFAQYDAVRDNIQSTVFDGTSIMEYPIPPGFTTDGFTVGWNNHLSANDIQFIGTMYPFPPTSLTSLETGSFNTMSIRSWDRPANENVGTINFTIPRPSPPTLLLGINWFDMGFNVNTRLLCKVVNVAQTSASINLQSFSDTVNYSSGCSWLTVPSGDSDFQSGHFSTADDHVWSSPQALTSRKITFAKAYSAPPKVVVWLDSIDVGYNCNPRFTVFASDIQADGFTIHVDTWGGSNLYLGGATWAAYSANRTDIRSGSYNITDVRSWDSPQLLNAGQVAFGGANFSKLPNVFMALNSIDVAPRVNPRIRLSASDITTSGMTWHLDAWSDTVLYTAGASYIAFDQ
ncbi:hypothetical protein EW026_g5430 [Hermanssonia centrifuga]|uniref:Peptidase metallopeptidase domain-containing protein n=1 Tax=Hermanssonia centrifuga TaxID=98765 RepID=A0A4S4KE60_9APHY|nr:hypothetical protein EW026_g5430 [Hermanssonia centrifuga]